MDKIYLDNISVRFDRTAMMEANRIKPDTDLAEEFMGVIDAAEGALKCKAVLKQAVIGDITEDCAVLDGTEFRSASVAKSLKGKKLAFLYVMTVGTEIDGCEDADYPVLGDIVRQEALNISMKYTLEYVMEKYNCCDISFINPGTLEDWPVVFNRTVFELIDDVTGLTGVILTPNGFMKPWYSSAGIIIA